MQMLGGAKAFIASPKRHMSGKLLRRGLSGAQLTRFWTTTFGVPRSPLADRPSEA